MQARFTEYLDGRLTGAEMHCVATHLDRCRECASEWVSLRQTQAALAAAGPVKAPADLLLKIRVAVSHERARRLRSPFVAWNMAWKNTVGPFLLQAAAGFASAVLLLGTVTVLVTMFTHPAQVAASADAPLGNATAPRRSTVTIDVAVPGTVPDVTNMSLDAAKAAIVASGYTIGNVAVTQDGAGGKVARTEPEANAQLRPGEAVTIYYHGVAP